MGSSLFDGKFLSALTLLNLEREHPLSAVVDIGAGMGTWSRLLRGVLPTSRWIAVEIWGPDVERYALQELYDAVHVSDLRCFDLRLLPAGGVALLGNAMACMPLDDAVACLGRVLTVCDYALLSIRVGEWKVAGRGEHPWARQMHCWQADDLHRLPGGVHAVFLGDPALVVMICAASPQLQARARTAIQEACQELERHGLLHEPGARGRDYTDPAFLKQFQTRLLGLPAVVQAGERMIETLEADPERRAYAEGWLLGRLQAYVRAEAWEAALRVLERMGVDAKRGSREWLEAALRVSVALKRYEQIQYYAMALLERDGGHVEAHQALIERATEFNAEQIEALFALATRPPQSDQEASACMQRVFYGLSAVLLFGGLDPVRLVQARELLALGLSLPPPVEPDPVFTKIQGMLSVVDLERVFTPGPQVLPALAVRLLGGDGRERSLQAVQATMARHGTKVLFLTAMDEKYFNRYARDFVQGLFERCEVPFLVVIGLVGCGERVPVLAQSLGIDDERLVICGHDPEPAIADGRVYGCVRFMLLEYFLEAFAVPVCCTDVDLVMQRGLGSLVEHCAGYDIVFNENRIVLTIGDRFVANLTWFNPTPVTRQFARFIRSYFQKLLDAGLASDFVDQIVLSLSRRHLEQFAAPRLGRLDPLDINNFMFNQHNIAQFRTIAGLYRFLSLYVSGESSPETVSWWKGVPS
ncbi:MAG: hypothetical protein HQL91_03525 [Magnetococcales bacterium]|nr:hypothetical protein [Magnetococcales bacterium]